MKLLKFAILFWLMISFIEGKGQTPQSPEMVSVSVMSDGTLEINWSVVPHTSITGFRIYRWMPGFDPVIDIDGQGEQSWNDPTVSSTPERYIYNVSTLFDDGTGTIKETPMSIDKFQSIYLKPQVIYDECNKKNTIFWSEYMINGNAESYKIWFTNDLASPWQDLQTILTNNLNVITTESTWGNTPQQTNIYEYSHNNITRGIIYYYKIEAQVINGVSENVFSNIISFNTPAFNTPSNLLLENVTVNLNNEVEISGSVTDLQFASSGNIERSNDFPFNPDYSIDLSISTSTEISEIDSDADPDQSSYYYRISLKDKCYDDINSSEFRTIHLHAELNGDSEVNLEWNEFVGWNVEKYNIYIQRQSAPTIWTPIDPSTTSIDFKHDLSSIPPEESMFKYRIEAVENNGNKKSSSNTVTVYRSFDPEMPTAFNPNSTKTENTTFKPVITFYNSTNYTLQIYNRWGAVIWETNDPDEGWTGKNKSGKLQPMGVYVYLLQYEEAADLVRTKRGTVTLIH